MLRSGAPLPSFDGATRWINGEVAPGSLAGRPVLVQFWAVSCHLCQENQPVLKRWREGYASRGVRFVSVHMPRQETDTRVDAVAEAVREHGMDEPVAIDNDHVIGRRFETGGLWPAYFLFDESGKLRCRAAGAAGLSVMQSAIERLIAGGPS